MWFSILPWLKCCRSNCRLLLPTLASALGQFSSSVSAAFSAVRLSKAAVGPLVSEAFPRPDEQLKRFLVMLSAAISCFPMFDLLSPFLLV